MKLEMALNLNNNLLSLKIGDYFWCKYVAPTYTFGVFSDLAEKTDSDILNQIIPLTVPNETNGYFRFIMVDEINKQKLLIADRNIQHVSWDGLNSVGVASGNGLPIHFHKKISELFTSPTSTNGHVVESSENYSSSLSEWRAFDGSSTNSSCWAVLPNRSAWLSYKFPTPQLINRYKIFPNGLFLAQSPKTWTFEGSNNKTDWTIIDAKENITGWTVDGLAFNFHNKSKFLYYRINISQFSGATDAGSIGELELYEDIFSDILFTVRLPKGGIVATNKDNEWDKYIVDSTLNNSITAGDDVIWNWSKGYSQTPATTPGNATGRIVRGVASSSAISGIEAPYVPTSSFRPVLLININPINKTIIKIDQNYQIWDNGWQIISSLQPTVEQFKNKGMDILTLLDRDQKVITQNMVDEDTSGAGKLFITTIDLKKYFEIKSLSFSSK